MDVFYQLQNNKKATLSQLESIDIALKYIKYKLYKKCAVYKHKLIDLIIVLDVLSQVGKHIIQPLTYQPIDSNKEDELIFHFFKYYNSLRLIPFIKKWTKRFAMDYLDILDIEECQKNIYLTPKQQWLLYYFFIYYGQKLGYK